MFPLPSIRSTMLSRFCSLTALETVSKEILSTYDSTLYDLINDPSSSMHPHSSPSTLSHSILLVSTILVYQFLSQEQQKLQKLEPLLFSQPNLYRQHIRAMILLLFFVLTKNVANAI